MAVALRKRAGFLSSSAKSAGFPPQPLLAGTQGIAISAPNAVSGGWLIGRIRPAHAGGTGGGGANRAKQVEKAGHEEHERPVPDVSSGHVLRGTADRPGLTEDGPRGPERRSEARADPASRRDP